MVLTSSTTLSSPAAATLAYNLATTLVQCWGSRLEKVAESSRDVDMLQRLAFAFLVRRILYGLYIYCTEQ
jgi:hypothetical protein